MTYPSRTPTRTPRRIKQMRPDESARSSGPIRGSSSRSGHASSTAGTCRSARDTIIVEQLADDLSAEFGMLRAPTLEYGVNVATERGFPGNASLRKKTLHRMLNDLLDTWESTGVKEFILLTAHEHDPHQEALATVITTKARVRVVDMFAMDFRELLEGQTEPMHGDEVGYLADAVPRAATSCGWTWPRTI